MKIGLGHSQKRMATLVCCFAPLVVVVYSVTAFMTNAEEQDLKVVIDADPGGDDAMAMLIMLHRESRANVLSLTCVEGNTGVRNAAANALLVLEVANRTDIPVYSGSEQGLVTKESSDNFFGNDGLGDAFDKPSLKSVRSGHAALAIANTVMLHPGQVSILCIGPLTNIALAIHIYPRLLLEVKDMIILGGSYRGGGNKKPGAEFNFINDPEAASFVLSKVPQGKLVTLLPLETVDANSYSLDWRNNVLGAIESDVMRFLNKAEKVSLDKSDKWRPFDPLAAAILLDPAVVTNWTENRVYVETCGKHGRGAVFVDYKAKANNVRIVTDIDKQLFQNILISHLS